MRIHAPLFLGLLTSIATQAQQWTDPSFGTDGVVSTSLNAAYDGGTDVLLQPDGKLVVIGTIAGAGGGYDFLVARYNSDGSLDTDFGTGGFATYDVSTQDRAMAGALQADGGIVVVGIATTGGNIDKVVLRFTADGTPDTGFGTNGAVIIDDSVAEDRANDVAVQDDQKIVVVGQGFDNSKDCFYLCRLQSDGSFDPSFGTGGQVEHTITGDNCQANAVTLLADGRIVAAGSSYTDADTQNDLVVTCYLTDGTLDDTFNTDGKAIVALSSSNDRGYAVAVQADGKVLAGGVQSETGTPQIAVARLLTNGMLDAGFGVGGVARTFSGAFPTRCGGLAVDVDGRVLAAGTAMPSGGDRSGYLCRLLPNGTLDADFGAGGELIHSAAGVFEETPGVVVQPDGGVVVAGYAGAGTDINVRLIRYLPSVVTGIEGPAEEADVLRVHADRAGIDLFGNDLAGASYRLLDGAGRLIAEGRMPAANGPCVRLPLACASGVYTLALSGARAVRFVVAE